MCQRLPLTATTFAVFLFISLLSYLAICYLWHTSNYDMWKVSLGGLLLNLWFWQAVLQSSAGALGHASLAFWVMTGSMEHASSRDLSHQEHGQQERANLLIWVSRVIQNGGNLRFTQEAEVLSFCKSLILSQTPIEGASRAKVELALVIICLHVLHPVLTLAMGTGRRSREDEALVEMPGTVETVSNTPGKDFHASLRWMHVVGNTLMRALDLVGLPRFSLPCANWPADR